MLQIGDLGEARRAAGQELWFYSCNVGKDADPTTYHRGQFWWAIAHGATGSCYWAFGDEGGGGTSMNAYLIPGYPFSPLFLDPPHVIDGKHMEAIREGAQDYEYFVMLRARVAELDQRGVAHPAADEARELLQTGPARVVATIDRDSLSWDAPKDRGLMDRIRVRALELLARLGELSDFVPEGLLGRLAEPAGAEPLAALPANLWIDLSFHEYESSLVVATKLFRTDRLLFGTHAPLFYPRSNVLKIVNSEAPADVKAAVTEANARALLGVPA